MTIIDGYWYGMILGIVIGFAVCLFIFSGSYKNGQIDAFNGDMKYELVIQKDNSSKWVKIEDN